MSPQRRCYATKIRGLPRVADSQQTVLAQLNLGKKTGLCDFLAHFGSTVWLCNAAFFTRSNTGL